MQKQAAEVSMETSGQAFSAVQLFQDLELAPPELQALAENAWKSVQQGAFPEAVKCLAQLEANPALNDAQKKSTVDLAEQVKKQVATTAAAK
jgi:hypothetical protein